MTKKIKRGSAPHKPISTNIQSSTNNPEWKSSNWSGYAIKRTNKNSFRSISAYWIVPRVKPSKSNKYSSAWIGIDGFNNSSLIQTGTQHDSINGRAVYNPWWEILPAPETKIPLRVTPGDLMYARITKLRGNIWSIFLANKTKGWSFKKITTYDGPGTSAEWILEAPTVNGKTAQLANYGKTIFYKSRVNLKNPLFKLSDRGIMIQDQQVVSTPSIPNKRRDSFTVAYGSKIPRPPK